MRCHRAELHKEIYFECRVFCIKLLPASFLLFLNLATPLPFSLETLQPNTAPSSAESQPQLRFQVQIIIINNNNAAAALEALSLQSQNIKLRCLS